MGLLPQGVADVDPILRWFIELRLQLIEEAACGPQDSGTGAPGMEEGRDGAFSGLWGGIGRLMSRPLWTT